MKLSLIASTLALISLPVFANSPVENPPSKSGSNSSAVVILPPHGQSQKQVETDTTDCREAAKNKTGFDPSIKSQDQKNVAEGAAGGGALGAAMGHTPRGAAIGAVRARHQNQKDNEHQATEQAQFNEAQTSCLESRGYTVAQK